MIKIENLNKSYFTDTLETQALQNINLDIAEGEFISIMGPSGCGKSTLLNMIGLIDQPTDGQIFINQMQLEALPEKKLAEFRNQHLGFIFQSFHLISDLSVIDNVELPLLYRKVNAKKRKEMAEAALEKVGLLHRKNHYPNQLSGGQRQRVAIARAIIGQPSVLLADEPTGNLDSVLGTQVMDLLMELNSASKVTIVMVTHDEAIAQRTNRIVRLFDGNIVN
ncbi:putative ABC transport system ATP-binding protein [Zhouia amylolytica]|uniref:Putative ABC transport system ATP-binding protein n=1 Tax=Zhouia amylolytica TaxID=376730 RepID=A0A1I6QT28_9FLAO|nr:ABC transporter ATP-binding protein [Zhouia amylolytica]MCQ0112078.1 ABC transporter ATP-binding protein [Zhouia amylolytica]SFS55583.1 putative ABC transport system ATP-binding protein [Zhouia amylolytica]